MTTLLAAANVEGAVSASITFGPNSAVITNSLITGGTALSLGTNVGNAIAQPGSWVEIADGGLSELCQVASVNASGSIITLAAPGCANAHFASAVVVQAVITAYTQQAIPPRSPG